MKLVRDFNIYIGSSTGAFKGVNLNNEKLTIQNIQNVKYSTNKFPVVALNWYDEEESEIIVAYAGQKIKIYDIAYGNFNTNTDVSFGKGDIVGVSRYDQCILTAVQSGDVKLWRYKSEKDQWTNFNVGGEIERMRHNRFNNIMATGGKENDLKLWDLNTTKNIFNAKNVKPDEFDLRKPVWVNDIQFLPNSEKVAVCSKQGYVRIFDPKVTTQRRPVINVEVPNCAFTCLSTTNQSHYVIVGSGAGDMMAIDLRGKGKPCYKYKGFAGCVKDIKYGHNDNLIFSVSLDRHFRVHDFHSKKLLRKEYMQSRLVSILVKSDFKLDSISKNETDEIVSNKINNRTENGTDNAEDKEEELYDPENFQIDKQYENKNISLSNNVDDDSDSDLEIVEEVINNDGNDSNNEEIEEEGEEEQSENEFYEEEENDEESDDDDDESNDEGDDDDDDEELNGDDELFPLEGKSSSKKRKLNNGNEITIKKKSK